MAWSSVAIGVVGFAAGVAVTTGVYERAARKAADLRADIAEQRPAEQVQSERRIVKVEQQAAKDREQARTNLAAAPELADCPVPPELARLLDAQAAASRARGGAVPDRGLSRQAESGVQGD